MVNLSAIASRSRGEIAGKLTGPSPPTISHDRHDFNDPFTLLRYQRQQRRLAQESPPPATPEQTSPPSSQRHLLRRTPRFSATPSPQPLEPSSQQSPVRVSVTLGPQGRYVVTGLDQSPARRRSYTGQLSQELDSEDLGEESTHPPSSFPQGTQAPGDRDQRESRGAVNISRHLHSAILFALEETLRGPKPLSHDLIEELAPMADLIGSGGTATSNGNAASPSRPIPARAPVGSPSGIRGPRMIMQERAAREARQREERERERMEREHAEQEARALEETQRRDAERRAAAGAGGSGAGAVPTNADPSGARRTTAATDTARPVTGGGPRAGAESQTQRPVRASSTAAGPSGAQTLSGVESVGAATRVRNSFPHAFERWETLSAHWEGLTNFWLRRLEQNSKEVSNDPLNQQLARQVTDLSSAGANLFHAVVELQRLRASSERKFQRWFFETRTELERYREEGGRWKAEAEKLQAELDEERRHRAEAVREASEGGSSAKVQKRLEEMHKELQISKDEARRAWEELGRHQDDERQRTASLQQGQPTLVGGVQVVPMTQGVGRGGSQRDPRNYAAAEPEYSEVSSSRPEYSQAPAVQPISSSGASGPYPQPVSAVHHQGSYGSEGTYSEGEYTIDAQGHFVRNSRGEKIPFYAPTSEGDSDVGAEEYDTPSRRQGGGPQQPQYSTEPEPDYTGAGFNEPGWEVMGGPRHHHPTRLSDVIEEEERSNQSQVSRG
jgi:hypothetical protein